MIYEDNCAATYRDELNTLQREINVRFLKELITINNVKQEKEKKRRMELFENRKRKSEEVEKIKKLKVEYNRLKNAGNLLFKNEFEQDDYEKDFAVQKVMREHKEKKRSVFLLNQRKNELIQNIIMELILNSSKIAEREISLKLERERIKKLKEDYERIEQGELKIEETSLATFRKKRIEAKQKQEKIKKIKEKGVEFENKYTQIYDKGLSKHQKGCEGLVVSINEKSQGLYNLYDYLNLNSYEKIKMDTEFINASELKV